MSLPDPTTVTVSTVAKTLNRVSVGENKSHYVVDDGTLRLTASHTYNRRTRRMVRLDFDKTGVDPVFPTQNASWSGSAYIVLDHPKVGFTNAELVGYLEALADLMKVADYSEKFVTGQN